MVGDRALGRRFWLLWSSASMSNIGDGITLTAFPLLAVSLTDDARLVALVTAVRFLPFVVIGLPLGVLIDRFDRRIIGLVAQGVRAVVLGLVATVVAADDGTILLLCLAAFVVGLAEVLIDGSGPAMIRQVVRADQLELANARLASTSLVTNLFVGPPLGAALFAATAWAPFVAVVVAFVLAAVLLAVVPGSFRPERDADEQRGFRAEIGVGLRYVWHHPVLRPLALTVAVFAFLGEAGNAVLVILATERLGLDEVGFGLLISIDAAAALIVSLVVAGFIARRGHVASLRLSMALFAAAALLLGLSTTIVGALAAMVLMGASDPSWNVVSQTLRQRLVPDEIFGRMMTAYLTIAWGIQPIGAVVGGVLAEAAGPEWVYLAQVPIMLAMLLVGARPLFRAIPQALDDAPA